MFFIGTSISLMRYAHFNSAGFIVKQAAQKLLPCTRNQQEIVDAALCST